MTVESNNPGMGFDESIDAIAAILEPKPATREPREPKAQVTEAEEAEPAEEVEAEAEESEQDADEATDDEQDDDQPAEAKVEELEIDGKKVKLAADIAALIKPNLLRQQDYTRKTQEAAEIRKAAEAERQAAQHRLREYEQGLGLVARALQESGPRPPDPSLLNEDPIEFVRQREAWQAHSQKLGALNAEFQRIEAVKQQQAEQEAAVYRSEQLKRLPEVIPSWKDAKKAEADQRLIRDELKSRGMDDEDIKHISMNASAEHIAILQEWASLKRLFAQRQQAKPQAPVVAPTGKPSANTESTQLKRARDAFRKSGGSDRKAAEFLITKFL
jgi:hypothetical protein